MLISAAYNMIVECLFNSVKIEIIGQLDAQFTTETEKKDTGVCFSATGV